MFCVLAPQKSRFFGSCTERWASPFFFLLPRGCVFYATTSHNCLVREDNHDNKNKNVSPHRARPLVVVGGVVPVKRAPRRGSNEPSSASQIEFFFLAEFKCIGALRGILVVPRKSQIIRRGFLLPPLLCKTRRRLLLFLLLPLSFPANIIIIICVSAILRLDRRTGSAYHHQSVRRRRKFLRGRSTGIWAQPPTAGWKY